LTPRQYAAIKWQTAGGNEYDSKCREAEYEKAAIALTKTSENPKKFQNHQKTRLSLKGLAVCLIPEKHTLAM
jgi:hypothetical protein